MWCFKFSSDRGKKLNKSSKLIGRWKLESKKNWDSYLKELGMIK